MLQIDSVLKLATIHGSNPEAVGGGCRAITSNRHPRTALAGKKKSGVNDIHL